MSSCSSKTPVVLAGMSSNTIHQQRLLFSANQFQSAICTRKVGVSDGFKILQSINFNSDKQIQTNTELYIQIQTFAIILNADSWGF